MGDYLGRSVGRGEGKKRLLRSEEDGGQLHTYTWGRCLIMKIQWRYTIHMYWIITMKPPCIVHIWSFTNKIILIRKLPATILLASMFPTNKSSKNKFLGKNSLATQSVVWEPATSVWYGSFSYGVEVPTPTYSTIARSPSDSGYIVE
jgi:hypothetical protein